MRQNKKREREGGGRRGREGKRGSRGAREGGGRNGKEGGATREVELDDEVVEEEATDIGIGKSDELHLHHIRKRQLAGSKS